MQKQDFEQIGQYFKDSAEKFSSILEIICRSMGEEKLTERRTVLLEVMSNLARQSIGVENIDYADIINKNFQNCPLIQDLIGNITNNLRSTRKILKEKKWQPTIASLHYRALWLDDGRTTRAATRFKAIDKLREALEVSHIVERVENGGDADQEQKYRKYNYSNYMAIYHGYLAIYSRHFVLVEKVLNLV